jgi:hypothetical protein
MKTILRLTLALLLASLEGALAQSLEFGPALELRYQTQPGRAFRLESSTDLTTWTPWSPTRLGDGQPVRELVPAGDSARTFRPPLARQAPSIAASKTWPAT